MTPEQTDEKPENRKSHEQKIKGIKESMNNRRLQVLKQKIQGFTNQEIANNLNVSLSTVEKDVSRIKDFSFKLFNDLKEAGVITEIAKSYTQIEIIEAKLWEIYKKNEAKPDFQVSVLKNLSDLTFRKMELFRSEDRITLTSNYTDIILKNKLSAYESQSLKDGE
jgi:Bacterial regulatory proteins, luxR family